MINRAHYLVSDKAELQELEGKIEQLTKDFGFNCHPIANPEIINYHIIVRKNSHSNTGCVVTPFPDCELSIIDMQRKSPDKPVMVHSNSERVVLTAGSEEYLVYYRYRND